MSFYVDDDDDSLHKEAVELVCGMCSTRFKKYKVDVKSLRFFDESLVKKDGKKDSCCPVGEVCNVCKKFKSKDLLDRPFKCPFCDKLFAHSRHLLKHKLRHTDEESSGDVVVEEDNFERISIDTMCGCDEQRS